MLHFVTLGLALLYLLELRGRLACRVSMFRRRRPRAVLIGFVNASFEKILFEVVTYHQVLRRTGG